MLSLPARQAIFRSMALQMVSGGTTIISQGDTDATKFYVLEKGTCDVLISSDATGNVPKKVHTYTSGRYSIRAPCKIVLGPYILSGANTQHGPNAGECSGHALLCFNLSAESSRRPNALCKQCAAGLGEMLTMVMIQ